jgi:hypothetical protein
MLGLWRKEEKNTIMKISGNEMKQFDRFICLGSVVEKNGKIQNEINKRISKGLQFYHVIRSILWNRDIESVQLQYARCTLRRYCYVERRRGNALRERKAKHKQLR